MTVGAILEAFLSAVSGVVALLKDHDAQITALTAQVAKHDAALEHATLNTTDIKG